MGIVNGHLHDSTVHNSIKFQADSHNTEIVRVVKAFGTKVQTNRAGDLWNDDSIYQHQGPSQ